MELRLALAVLLVALAFAGCGGANETDHHESVADARRAMEALPYVVEVRQKPDRDGALLVKVHGKLGESALLYVFVHGYGPLRIERAVRALGVRSTEEIEGGALTESYAAFSRVHEPGRESRRQKAEAASLLLAAEDALCHQATGETCGI